MRKGQTCYCLAGMPAMLAEYQTEHKSIETRPRNKRGHKAAAGSDAYVYIAIDNGG